MKRSILIIIFCLFFGSIYPQENDSLKIDREIQYDRTGHLTPLKFDREKIDDYKSRKEFDYINTAEKDNWWTRFKKWINAKYNQFINWLFGEYQPNSFLSFIIAILPFVLLLIFLGLVAWLFSRLNPGGHILHKPKTSEIFLTEEEELIKSEDLPALIKKAVKNGEFRLAVRYYYLNELRKLDQLHLIDYEYQKTNKDYSEEITDEEIRAHFYEITKLYEFVWYGNFQVSESDYRLVEKGFLRMEKVLNTVGHE